MRSSLIMAAALLSLVPASRSFAAVELNNYILDFVSAAAADNGNTAAIANASNVDFWNYLGSSAIFFKDVDGSGGISKGDTFRDVGAFEVTGFRSNLNSNVTPAGYGTSGSDTFGLTIIFDLNGVQTSDTAYKFTGINKVEIWFDAGATQGADGNAADIYSVADFSNIATFADGVLAESSSAFAAPSGGSQDNPFAPDGSVSASLILNDLIPIELLSDGSQIPSTLTIGGITDSNNNAVSNDTLMSALASFFGVDETGVISPTSPPPGTGVTGLYANYVNEADIDFAFLTSNDGSVNKVLIPEPTAFLVWSVLAMTAVRARKPRV